MAVPGNITNPRAYGCNHLIQQGAKLVQGVEDILVEIGMAEEPPQSRQLELPGVGLSADEEKLLGVLSQEPGMWMRSPRCWAGRFPQFWPSFSSWS